MLIVILHSCFTPIKRTVQSLNHDMPYFRISSLHCLCVAKQAMAHILISTPVWNCFPRMSHTPWLGVATVRFWENKSNRHSSDWKRSSWCYLQFQDNKEEIIIQNLIPAESNCTGSHSSKWKPEEKPKPHPSSVLQHRGWEHTSCHMGHLIPHFELELLHKGICIIICTSHLGEIFPCYRSIWL